MAKERDGSINIYGSLQAKTEDGYVAYTDGIAHENEDGTTTSLEQLLADGVGGGGIIDVDSLPQPGWTGTAVTVDGATEIKEIYFNTNLSIEETIAEMDKITDWIDINSDSLYAIFLLAAGNGIILAKMSGVYIIVSLDYATVYFISDGSVMGFDFSGWNPAITYPIAINAASLTEMDGVPVGTQNDKISNLISTTSFEYSETGGDEKVIYRLKGEKPDKTHLEGTLLVSNPDTTVNKVFFNNELSVEETVEILSGLTYTNFNGTNVNILYCNANTTHVIFVVKFSDTEYNIVYSPSIAEGTQGVLIFTSIEDLGQGWKLKEKEINDVGITELYGLSIGTENDKLLKVLSMNDGFTEVVDSYKDSYTYWAYKDKWLQLIDSDNYNKEGLTEYVDLGVFVQQTSSSDKKYAYKGITKEQYNKIFNNDNIVVKLQIEITEGNESMIMPYQLYPNVSGTASLFGFSAKVKYYFCISSLESIDQNNVVGSQNHRLIILSGFYKEDTGIYTVGISITDIEDFRQDSLYFYTRTINNELYLRSVYSSSSSIPSSAEPIDRTPTKNSTTLVTSGGVYTALQNKQNKITVTENDDGTVDITIPTE